MCVICVCLFESVCLCIRLYVTFCSISSVSEEVQQEFIALIHMLHIFLSTGGANNLKRQRGAWGGDEDVRRRLQTRWGGAEVSRRRRRGYHEEQGKWTRGKGFFSVNCCGKVPEVLVHCCVWITARISFGKGVSVLYRVGGLGVRTMDSFRRGGRLLLPHTNFYRACFFATNISYRRVIIKRGAWLGRAVRFSITGCTGRSWWWVGRRSL